MESLLAIVLRYPFFLINHFSEPHIPVNRSTCYLRDAYEICASGNVMGIGRYGDTNYCAPVQFPQVQESLFLERRIPQRN